MEKSFLFLSDAILVRCNMNGEGSMIRKATAADANTVRGIARAAYGRYIAAMGRQPAPMVADFHALIAAGHVYVTDARDGFVVFFERDGAMFLENVAVHPDAAGKGTGRALIAFCEDAARGAGLTTVTLYTNAKMTENLSIYPHLGYECTDRRMEDGFDRVYFSKRI
jgi:GNAT superfamily N-acetyltransferase